MKKIAVLTLVFDNYGTRLQTYALCKVLQEIVKDEATVEVVNLEGTWGGPGSAISKKKQLLDVFKTYGIHIPARLLEVVRWKMTAKEIAKQDHSAEIADRSSLFEHIRSLIPYTETYYTCEDIRNGKLPKYDAYVVGSDQVWNGIKVGNQDIFMLDFLPIDGKGLTYAASFGMTKFPQSMYDDYKRRINNFSSLLIREQEGVTMCKQLGRDDAKFVLDPTLLLCKSDYMTDLSYQKNRIGGGNFILVYSLNGSIKIYDEAYKLAKKNGCNMVVLKRNFCPPAIGANYPGSEELFSVSPEEFLWLIENASCVITNSYHALLFSVNFKTNFYLYLDNADEENSRLLTLSRLCHLEDRICWATGHLPYSFNDIDYTPVHEILREQKEHSIALLKESILRAIR